MVKVRYIGVLDAQSAFKELRPFWDKLGELQRKCHPASVDYAILRVTRQALDTATLHFTDDATFYGIKPDQSRSVQTPDPSRLGREGW